ncbi:MAG TPA: hypothetical protein VM492_17785 [Sumerlaeia bacterium]|nr:hypothetical protein [Sumerlaeia bacterium]
MTLASAAFLGLRGGGEADDSPEAIDIGNRRELFVDRFLIDRMKGVELRAHPPRPAGAALEFDKPWEGPVSGYVTVLQDGGKRRMYYRGRPLTGAGDATKEAKEVACYAESSDGVHWVKPNLGLYEIDGARDNNVVLADAGPPTHNFCPFIDARPGVPASERYKAVGGTSESGLIAYVSGDGIRWKKLREEAILTKGAFDTQNVVFWSKSEDCYVCFFRTWKNGVRWIARATSKDFLNWTDGVDMSFGDAPPEHLYTNQTNPYFRAPHIYVGIAARFWPGREALTEEQVKSLDLEGPRNYGGLKSGCSDAVLLTSRGGDQYDRTFLESLIRPGTSLRNWVARSNYPALGLVQTSPEEMSCYVQRHYGQPSAHLERLVFRLDGFASVRAPYSGGEMVTKPFTFQGKELEINFSTSAPGSVRVEIQDAQGNPVPGYTLDNCPEIIGDEIARIVSWAKGPDVGELAGKPVRLRFVMKDADLFSMRFR